MARTEAPSLPTLCVEGDDSREEIVLVKSGSEIQEAQPPARDQHNETAVIRTPGSNLLWIVTANNTNAVRGTTKVPYEFELDSADSRSQASRSHGVLTLVCKHRSNSRRKGIQNCSLIYHHKNPKAFFFLSILLLSRTSMA